mgnify:CR=1 FL=1
MVSPPTNKQILEWGLTTCVDGACLAIKSYVGHSQALVRQGTRLLFVPQIISISRKEYTCPNFLGLPDLLKQYLPPSIEMLSPTLDARKSERALRQSYLRLGLQFTSLVTVKQAWNRAVEGQRAWEQSAYNELPSEDMLQILVLGPRYLTDDPFLSGNLRAHLESLGAQVYTASQVPDEISLELCKSVNKRLFWSGSRRSMGTLEHFLHKLDGVINVAPFGCGAESLVGVLLTRRAREHQIAMLDLTVDEHTSEVGMITRLEAFCDLLERKKSG